MGCLASALRSWRRSLRSRTTTSSPARPICASCTTAMAFPASSRPTMPVPRARKTISQPAGRCLRRRAPISPVSRRSSAEVQTDDTVILAAVMKSWTEASLFPCAPDEPSERHAIVHRRRSRLSRRRTRRRRIGRGSRRSPMGCSSPCRPESRRNELRSVIHRAVEGCGGGLCVVDSRAQEPNPRTAREKAGPRRGACGW